MVDENNVIAEEIYEYYQDKIEKEPDEKSAEESAEESGGEQRKTVFSPITHAFSGITDKLIDNPQDKKGLYITLVVLAAVMIILCGVVAGLAVPKNEKLVTEKIDRLKSTDTRYEEEVKNNERLSERVNELYDESSARSAELSSITDYEAIRDRSKQDINDITAQIEELQIQIEEKKAQVSEIDKKIEDMGGEVTLTPGMYTVGKHIAAGEYYLKGDGSILVSDSEGKLKINVKLTKTASHKCQLSEGDTIKLETKADFSVNE